MDWMYKSWETEDEEFNPKRRVNNKVSWKIHHIIGSFHSSKMQRTVEYESLGEKYFYYLLELDKTVIRYYVQPLTIDIPYRDKDGKKKTWPHVPDVLVFRQGSQPSLYQIKDDNEAVLTNKQKNVNKACLSYSRNKEWMYSVIFPKNLPKPIISNIKFLIGFTKKRKYYNEVIPKLITKLSQVVKKSTIKNLSESFEPELNSLLVLPAIYHLIATGSFIVSLSHPINEMSKVMMGSGNDFLNSLIKKVEL